MPIESKPMSINNAMATYNEDVGREAVLFSVASEGFCQSVLIEPATLQDAGVVIYPSATFPFFAWVTKDEGKEEDADSINMLVLGAGKEIAVDMHNLVKSAVLVAMSFAHDSTEATSVKIPPVMGEALEESAREAGWKPRAGAEA